MRVRSHQMAALFVGLTLVVAACADDSGGDTTSAATTATTTRAATTQAPATTSVPTTEAPATTQAATTTTEAAQGLTGLVITDVGFDATFGESTQDGWVFIRNFSGETISLEGYFLCQRPSYFALPAVELGPGDSFLISAADFEGLADGWGPIPDDEGTAASGGLGTLDLMSGEMALYSSSDFGDPSAIVSYVEWGGSGHGRSSVAVAAGIWDEAMFVPTDTVEFPGAISLDVRDPDNPVWDVIEAP